MCLPTRQPRFDIRWIRNLDFYAGTGCVSFLCVVSGGGPEILPTTHSWCPTLGYLYTVLVHSLLFLVKSILKMYCRLRCCYNTIFIMILSISMTLGERYPSVLNRLLQEQDFLLVYGSYNCSYCDYPTIIWCVLSLAIRRMLPVDIEDSEPYYRSTLQEEDGPNCSRDRPIAYLWRRR